MTPEGWFKTPLSKLSEVRTGIAKGKKEHAEPVTVPYLRVANVQDGYIDLTEVKEIEVERRMLERYSLKVGDVLMNEGGDFDKLGRGDVWMGQIVPCLHQNHVFAVRPNPTVLDSFFLAALAASHYGKSYFLRCSKRSTNLASINSTQLKGFPVVHPGLNEQKKIAQILSTWDKAIAATEQLLTNSQQQKKALMQQLLTGKRRLPGFSGEWNSLAVSEVAEVIISPVDKKTVDGEQPVLLCNYTDVYYQTKITKSVDFMKATAKPREINRFTLRLGDVIITKDSETPGDIAVPAFVSEDLDGVVCGYHLAILRPNKEALDGAFLTFVLSMALTRYYFYTLATGATRFGLSVGAINNAELFLPPIEEQVVIAKVIESAEQQTENLNKHIQSLKIERKALMQQLLTGKRRVTTDKATA